jgi:hypothetical protein
VLLPSAKVQKTAILKFLSLPLPLVVRFRAAVSNLKTNVAHARNLPAEQKADTMTDTTAAILAHPTCTPEELCHLLQSGKQATYRALKAGGIARRAMPPAAVR